MNTKVKTLLLMVVILFLLGSTLYVSFMLRNETETAPTTIQKTKAADQTYSRTIVLNKTILPLTPTFTPTPTQAPSDDGVSAAGEQSSATVGGSTPSPTETLLASARASVTPTISPTESMVANSSSPTPSIITSVTPTIAFGVGGTSDSTTISPTTMRTETLPDAGWIKPLHLMFVFGFSLIFFALLY